MQEAHMKFIRNIFVCAWLLTSIALQGCTEADTSSEKIRTRPVATDQIYVTTWCSEGGNQQPVTMWCTSYQSDTTGFRCYRSAEQNSQTLVGVVDPGEGCIISAVDVAMNQ